MKKLKDKEKTLKAAPPPPKRHSTSRWAMSNKANT